MITRIKSCFRSRHKIGKLFALFTISSVSFLQGQTEVLVDTFQNGYIGQPVFGSDTYYTSPAPFWRYTAATAMDGNSAYIAVDESDWFNQYMHFNGVDDILSMTWIHRDGGYLLLDPGKPFQIEFDLLNVTGEAHDGPLSVVYLIDERYANMGANALYIPGYQLEVKITGDDSVHYRIRHKTTIVETVPGSEGTATVASGVLSTQANVPGRPVHFALKVFQNHHQLFIDGDQVLDLHIDPLPQNGLHQDLTYVQLWDRLWIGESQEFGMDNIKILTFEDIPFVPGSEVYWANTSMIRTSETDGGTPRIVRSGFARGIGVAVDPVNEKLYWTDGDGGNIFRSDLTGEGEETIYSGSGSTQGIAVNPETGKIFWNEYSGGLFMADLDGSNPTQIINIADYGVPHGAAEVVIDRATQAIYWVEVYSGTLVRLQPDGSGAEILGTLGADAYGIAVDSEKNRVYYTVFSEGTLNSFDLVSQTSTLIRGELAQPLGVDITVDGTGLFWAERGEGKITRARLDDNAKIIAAEALRVGEDSPFYIVLMDTAVAPDVPPPFLGFLNGDFEADPFDKDWSVNIGGGVRPVAGIAPNSDTAVFIENDGKSRLIQYFPQWVPLRPAAAGASVPEVIHPDTGQTRSEYMTSFGPKWRFGFYVAAETLEKDGDRSLNLILGHLPDADFVNPNIPTINFRIIGTGALQAYAEFPEEEKGWKEVFPAGTFESSDLVDGEFVDPSVFYIQFDGDYSTEDPYYVVSIGRAGEDNFFAVSNEMRAWQYGIPTAGSGIAMVHFHGF